MIMVSDIIDKYNRAEHLEDNEIEYVLITLQQAKEPIINLGPEFKLALHRIIYYEIAFLDMRRARDMTRVR